MFLGRLVNAILGRKLYHRMPLTSKTLLGIGTLFQLEFGHIYCVGGGGRIREQRIDVTFSDELDLLF